MNAESQTADNILFAKVANTAELIKYQTGAIVSRTLIKKPTGTVTLFAFDAGQELSEHTAPFDALAHVLDGQAEITISGQAPATYRRTNGHYARRKTPCRQGHRTV